MLSFILFLLVCQRLDGNRCPPCSCDCRPFYDTLPPPPCLVCGNRWLTSIPKFPLNFTLTIKSLDVSRIHLPTLESNIFSNYSNLENLYLTYNGITNISEVAFNGLGKLRFLVLDHNVIQTIPGYTFQHMEMLEALTLDNNSISSICEDTFKGLKKLRGLKLTHNGIQSISHYSFQDLGNLVLLDLEWNRLGNISKDMFNGMGKLSSLSLSHNEIRTIHCYSFQQLPLLEGLSLGYNRLTSVSEKVFSGLGKLKHLFLSHNTLKTIPPYTFRETVMLEKLDLSNNNISSIPEDAFTDLIRLQNLELGFNRLKTIETFWTTKLPDATLNLRSNPFPCSCQTLNAMKHLQYRVQKLNPTWTYYEETCTNVTSVCEEERNFALGMNTFHSCYYPVKLGYITDGNLQTHGSCGPINYCSFYIRIELPGIIRVTDVIMVFTLVVLSGDISRYDGTLKIEVGDKLSGRYEPCHRGQNYTLVPSSDKTSINCSCDRTPYGRDVELRIKLSSMRHCTHTRALTGIADPKFYEVMIKGYEQNKYNLWSNWDQWGLCSESCGNGVRIRSRNCTHTTSLKCLLPDTDNQRALLDIDKESCNLKPCVQTVYHWTIGVVAGVFMLVIFAIVVWYRKFKMVTYFDGLWPNPNFEFDSNRTLLEQIEELPYDLHWEFPRYDIRFGPVLGEGHFGRVWLAKAKGIKAFNPRDHSDLSSRAKLAKLQDQRVHEYFTTITEAWVLGDCDTTHHYNVAVKTLKESATPQHRMDLASELKLLIYMDRHPNIVNVLAACTIRGDLWVIMEYCDHGCLKKFLSDRRNRFNPSWSKQSADILNDLCLFDLLQMCEQATKGVMFLHFWKVVHRDISARNILVDANCNLKIADFGLARSDHFVASVDDIMPIKWSALESLLRHEYTAKSDIWSVGVLFWEIFSLGEMPYPGMTSREVIQQLKEGYRMDPPSHCPEQMWNIISDTWAGNPEQRPSATELFQQLDEVKVSVCSAPDGQYYESGVDYGEMGTIEGPSLDEILEGRSNMGFEGVEAITHVDIHNAQGDLQENGSNTITYIKKLESENSRFKSKIQDLQNKEEKIKDIMEKTDLPDEERIEEIKLIVNTITKNNDSGHAEIMETADL